ncbi:hypothetical protein SAMN05216499_11661 [Actinacidiphila paucisporea]|uniref:Uncharacterized protein n=1 Tax=Actinacidiphila paucisporea TaxID=310782 RepID=A0A1M7MKA5_9ACTN|nr:hypothetical protein SAMN05216499_11661 [Actinacidiphila paucisporea]
MLGRYSYASHGLKFAIKSPTESRDAIRSITGKPLPATEKAR